MFKMRTCLRPRIRCQEKLWFLLQSLVTAPRKRFFFNKDCITVNKGSYCKHLQNSCFLQLKNLLWRDD